MKVLCIFSFLFFCFTSCNPEVDFRHETPKVSLEDLSSITIPCEYELSDGSCLIKKTEIFEIDPFQFSDLELLFILDTSSSMQDSLTKINQSFLHLISYINDFNWQMAFTTADHGDHDYLYNEQTKEIIFPPSEEWSDYEGDQPFFGRFMSLQLENEILDKNILKSTDANYENIFYDTISPDYFFDREKKKVTRDCEKPPYCQGNNEQPLRVLKSTIAQSKDLHEDFFSKDAVFAVLIITDERERNEDTATATTASEVIEEFSKKFDDKKMIVYGVSIQNDQCLEKQNLFTGPHVLESIPSVEYSKKLDDLVQLTGGMSVNICDDDYAVAFSDISKELRKYVRSIPLDKNAVFEKGVPLRVEIKDSSGQPVSLSFEINEDEKSILFEDGMESRAQIEVTYYIQPPEPSEGPAFDLSHIE